MFKVGDIVTPNERFLKIWTCEKFMYGMVTSINYDVLKLDRKITSKYNGTKANIISSSTILVKYMRLVNNKELQLIRKEKLEKLCSK